MWEVIPKITTAISFAAFLLTVLAYILKNSTQKKSDLIKNIPDKNRLSALKEMADNLGISAKKIENEELVYELVKERLKSQTSLTRTLYYLIFMVFLVASAIVVIQITTQSENYTNIQTQTNPVNSSSLDSNKEILDSIVFPSKIIKTKVSESTENKNKVITDNAKKIFAPQIDMSLFQGKKIKIYYTDSTSKLGGILKQNLDASGAFTDIEKLLDNQMPMNNIIKFKSNRKDLAEYFVSSVMPEKKLLLKLVDNSFDKYDLEIYLTY
jgi:hypothetical protein